MLHFPLQPERLVLKNQWYNGQPDYGIMQPTHAEFSPVVVRGNFQDRVYLSEAAFVTVNQGGRAKRMLLMSERDLDNNPWPVQPNRDETFKTDKRLIPAFVLAGEWLVYGPKLKGNWYAVWNETYLDKVVAA